VIAAKLRKVAVDMEIKAAIDGDLDFPDDLVLPFIINAVTDKRMLGEAASSYLRSSSRIIRPTFGQSERGSANDGQ
jgi:hypothetical protein